MTRRGWGIGEMRWVLGCGRGGGEKRRERREEERRRIDEER